MLSHGNGLAIDLYYPFWSLLADEFDLIVFDLRNHGWNTVGARQNHNIPTLIRDQERIFEAIDRHYGNTNPKSGYFIPFRLWSPSFYLLKATAWRRRSCLILPCANPARAR